MTKTRWKFGQAAALAAILLSTHVAAVSLTGCSTQNTGQGSKSTTSDFMTNGLCHDNCAGYAFAITQWQNCWCSNEAPGATTSVGSCNAQCPGYPSENCGNQQQGLFGYVALGKAPQGTLGAGGGGGVIGGGTNGGGNNGGGNNGGGNSGGTGGGAPSVAPPSSVPPSSAPPSSPPPQTVVQVSTQVQISLPPSSTPPPPVTVVQTQTQQNTETQVQSIAPTTIVQDPDTTVLSAPTSTVSSVATVTPTPILVTSAQAVTVGGSVVTNYVTSTPTMAPGPSPQNELAKPTKQGLSSGAVAGVTIAALLGAAAIVGALIFMFCWRRRKRNGNQQIADSEGGPKRNTSVLSRVGLLRTSDQSDDQHGSTRPTLPQINTSGIPVGDAGPGSALTMGSSQMSENRRFSRPLFSDNRLNPNALMTHPNLSRTSVGTLQDNQDYSRPLEVRNPDAASPRPAW